MTISIRTRFRTTFAALGMAAALFMPSLVLAAPIAITNPNFDPPDEDVSDNPYPGYGPISDWIAVGSKGINSNAGPFLTGQPHSGTHVALIQNSGSITQALSGFDPTKNYTATYFVSERGYGGSPATSTSVSLDGGTTSYSLPGNVLKTDTFRRVVSGPLSVSGASSDLQISSTLVSGDATLLIDTVSVTRAVPVVPDGGFETPVQPNTDVFTRWKQDSGAGSGTLVGSPWTFNNGGGITRNGSAFGPPAAPEGSQASILQNAGSSFSQTISGFEADVTYSLSFEAAGRNGGANEFEVLLDGTPLEFAGATSVTPNVNSYSTFTSDEFTTDGGSFELMFEGLGIPDVTSFIDDIRFNFVAEAPPTQSVPEPASIAIWSILGLCLAGYGYRRHKK